MKITAIVQQQKRKDRYSVFVDGKYAFSLSDGALLNSGITTGQEVDDTKLKEYQKLSADDKLYQNAIDYVARRPRSTWEMRDYLRRKQAEDEVIEGILNRLSDISLLDDLDFARRWVNNRRLLKATSRRKLRLELQQKHVSDEIIDTVLAEDTEETDERAVLRELVVRRRSRYPDRQKLMAYLVRQGYSYDDIRAVLEEED